jgi:hypothetical protein
MLIQLQLRHGALCFYLLVIARLMVILKLVIAVPFRACLRRLTE